MELSFKDNFDLSNYGGKFKLFKVNPLNLEYTFTAPVDAVTPEGKEIQKLVKVDWEKQMKSFKSAKEKEYREVIAITEANVMKTAAKKRDDLQKEGSADKRLAMLKTWIDEEVKGAEVLIRNALKSFEGIVKKQMETLWDKIAQSVDKKFKTNIRNMKITAILKIIGLVTVIVVAAAVSLAIGALGLVAAAASGGLSAIPAIAAIAGGVATIAVAAKKIVDVYSANWPNHKRSSKLLETKVKALQEALAYEEKKEGKSKLGPKEKIKLMMGNVAGKKKEVEKLVQDMLTFSRSMMQDIEKDALADADLLNKVGGMKSQLNTVQDKKKTAEITKAIEEYDAHLKDKTYKASNARRYLAAYEKLLVDADLILKEESKLDASRLGTLLANVVKIASSDAVGPLVELGKNGVKFAKAILSHLAAIK